jgi:hypothetical protein
MDCALHSVVEDPGERTPAAKEPGAILVDPTVPNDVLGDARWLEEWRKIIQKVRPQVEQSWSQWSTEWKSVDRSGTSDRRLVDLIARCIATGVLLEERAQLRSATLPKAVSGAARTKASRERAAGMTLLSAAQESVRKLTADAAREAHLRAFSVDRIPRPGGRTPNPGLDHVIAGLRNLFQAVASPQTPVGAQLRARFPWTKVVSNLLEDVKEAENLSAALGAKHRTRAITARAARL